MLRMKLIVVPIKDSLPVVSRFLEKFPLFLIHTGWYLCALLTRIKMKLIPEIRSGNETALNCVLFYIRIETRENI